MAYMEGGVDRRPCIARRFRYGARIRSGPGAGATVECVDPGQDRRDCERRRGAAAPDPARRKKELRERLPSGQTALAAFQGVVDRVPGLFRGTRDGAGLHDRPVAGGLAPGIGPEEDKRFRERGESRRIATPRKWVRRMARLLPPGRLRVPRPRAMPIPFQVSRDRASMTRPEPDLGHSPVRAWWRSAHSRSGRSREPVCGCSAVRAGAAGDASRALSARGNGRAPGKGNLYFVLRWMRHDYYRVRSGAASRTLFDPRTPRSFPKSYLAGHGGVGGRTGIAGRLVRGRGRGSGFEFEFEFRVGVGVGVGVGVRSRSSE